MFIVWWFIVSFIALKSTQYKDTSVSQSKYATSKFKVIIITYVYYVASVFAGIYTK